jgi:hypothetical protein
VTLPEQRGARTYTVKDNDRVLAEHVPAAEVLAVSGHASIFDDEDGSLVVPDTDGEPATLGALEALLEDHEATATRGRAR